MNETHEIDEIPAALREKFLSTLPGRLAAIEAAWEDFDSNPDEGRAQLRLHIHRLAGATGSYGYAELHAKACRFEEALDAGGDADELTPNRLETCLALERLIDR